MIVSKRGLGFILIGDPGCGKTSLALQFPKPLHCLSVKESGFDDLDMVGDIPPNCTNENIADYVQLMSALQTCASKTLVLDALSGFQELFFEYLIKEHYQGKRKEFYAYYQGPRQHAPQVMIYITQALDNLRARGINVILVGHTKVEAERTSMGADVLISTLAVDVGIREAFLKWSQATLFMTKQYNIDIGTASIGKGDYMRITEGKASQTTPRIMYCQQGGGHVAKNRLNLPEVIHLGKSAAESYLALYNNFPPKIQEAIKV